MPLVVLLVLLLCGAILGAVIITTPQELVDFTNKVNSGTSYSGETVYLDSDLDFTPGFSSSFVPIGKTTTYTFNGTFDGQGHTISNLAISSSLQQVGLFGCSYESTIKNVVMDSSCSITSLYNASSNSDTGSIVDCVTTASSKAL